MNYKKRIRPKSYKKRSYSCGKALRGNNGRRADNPYHLEDLPSISPIRRTYEGKGYGCIWGQVHRFLEARIGQQWHNVWAEFCERCNVEWIRHAVLRYIVQQDVEIVGGVVYGRHSLYGFVTPLRFDRDRDLFVHPRTGQLCGQKSHARKQAKMLRTNWRDRQH